MALSDKNKLELAKQLPFILEVCQDRWFRDIPDLWYIEIGQISGSTPLLPNSRRNKIEAEIRSKYLNDEMEWDDPVLAKQDVDREKAKARMYREDLKKLRADIAQALKNTGGPIITKLPSADEHVDRYLKLVGAGLLKLHLPAKDSHLFANKWTENPGRLPYFTRYVKGVLFNDYLAISDHRGPIDENAVMDISLLSYLHDLDILVSNETKFMRKAFEFLFRNEGKIMMTAQEFVRYLEKIGN